MTNEPIDLPPYDATAARRARIEALLRRRADLLDAAAALGHVVECHEASVTCSCGYASRTVPANVVWVATQHADDVVRAAARRA